jgi:hypothetical protein
MGTNPSISAIPALVVIALCAVPIAAQDVRVIAANPAVSFTAEPAASSDKATVIAQCRCCGQAGCR